MVLSSPLNRGSKKSKLINYVLLVFPFHFLLLASSRAKDIKKREERMRMDTSGILKIQLFLFLSCHGKIKKFLTFNIKNSICNIFLYFCDCFFNSRYRYHLFFPLFFGTPPFMGLLSLLNNNNDDDDNDNR